MTCRTGAAPSSLDFHRGPVWRRSDNPYHGSTAHVPGYAPEWRFLFGSFCLALYPDKSPPNCFHSSKIDTISLSDYATTTTAAKYHLLGLRQSRIGVGNDQGSNLVTSFWMVVQP
jgi:hypothetical protein